LRADGFILSEPGYDPATQLYLAPGPGINLGNVTSKPTQQDAYEALYVLEELLIEFPFVDEIDKSVALSALITPIIRSAIDVAPMHAISAPIYGSGKSFLMNTASAIATGRACPVTTAGKDEIELEKRIDAALIKSQPIIAIDNVNGILFGNKLAQAVEQRLIEVRPLGMSNTIMVENNACAQPDAT
jgi:putative DNA primase/helicase